MNARLPRPGLLAIQALSPQPPALPAPDPTLLLRLNLQAHRALFAHLDALAPDVCAAAAAMAAALATGGRLFFFGDGSSAGTSHHLAAELGVRLPPARQPVVAMAPGADGAAITAIASHAGDAQAVVRQITDVGRPGDCAVGLSTSGDSPDLLHALEAARARGLTCIALLGRNGGAARSLAHHAVVVPAQDSARIQEAHVFIGHTWCAQIEQALGRVPPA